MIWIEVKKIINQRLCPYYRILWSKSKRLHSMGIINSFYISRGTVKLKLLGIVTITHLNDFTVHFPNVDVSPPAESS